MYGDVTCELMCVSSDREHHLVETFLVVSERVVWITRWAVSEVIGYRGSARSPLRA